MAPKKLSKVALSDKKAAKGSKLDKKNADQSKKNSKAESTKGTNTSGDSKMTLCTYPPVVRPQVRERRPGRPQGGKRLMSREMPAKVRSAFRRSLDPCDNSNDSGLGFDHHTDPTHAVVPDRVLWNNNGERTEVKRPRMDIKMEDCSADNYSFPEPIRNCKDSTSLIRTAPAGSVPSLSVNHNQPATSGRAVPRCVPLSNRQSSSSPVALTTQLTNNSRYMEVSLTIVKQPEQQHRARYQTEGSRGAVKDREGNGFPVVQLTGYYQPTTLQVFIGTDVGKVTPHMFYQACKVSGKNSTPCVERKVDGTCVIELQLDPSKEMSATCDCVGILKERNVDVEHRFPEQLGNRSKKKSTRCRMIFRTTLTHDDGTQETLQVCSQPIVCTQPPGVPEICKKSLTASPAGGGLELFVLGKNFLKDTKVYFQQVDDDNRHVRWEQSVVPDKEYLQQTHFVCVIPPYRRPDITEPVTVRLCVVSSGKTSEPHQFVYTPLNGAIPSVHGEPAPHVPPPQAPFFNKLMWQSGALNKSDQDLGMMPPPESSLVPMATRRSSISVPSTSDVHSPPLRTLKQEYIDENSQNSIDPIDMHPERYRHVSESSLDCHPGDSNMSMMNDNSMDMFHQANSNDSMSMTRRNSMSNSMDVNLSNSQMSLADDSSCSGSVTVSSMVTNNRMVLTQPALLHSIMATAHSPTPTPEELKVMDLRMKMPMATVADLVNSNAPSMATLQSFGVTEASTMPLPAQSAQSVENFLTDIETKTLQLKSEVIADRIDEIIRTTASLADPEPVYLSSQRSFLTASSQNDAVMHLVAKSEAAAVAEQTMSQQSTMAPPITTISSMPSTLVESTIAVAPINTEKLDAFVNSTVESHIGSPDPQKDVLLPPTNQSPMITSRDVMLNSRASLMVSPLINTALPAGIMAQEIGTSSANLSPDVILNSQISPSLMCRNPTDSLLPPAICQPPTDANLMPVVTQPALHSPLTLVTNSEPEKVVLLKAAVDFLETAKKISEIESKALNGKSIMEDISQLVAPQSQAVTTTGNNFVTQQAPPVAPQTSLPLAAPTDNTKTDFVIPVPVKEMAGQDKKNDDRMIPQSFTSLTENELINLINPSCFDQV